MYSKRKSSVGERANVFKGKSSKFRGIEAAFFFLLVTFAAWLQWVDAPMAVQMHMALRLSSRKPDIELLESHMPLRAQRHLSYEISRMSVSFEMRLCLL